MCGSGETTPSPAQAVATRARPPVEETVPSGPYPRLLPSCHRHRLLIRRAGAGAPRLAGHLQPLPAQPWHMHAPPTPTGAAPPSRALAKCTHASTHNQRIKLPLAQKTAPAESSTPHQTTSPLPSKREVSTLHKWGSFYFALTQKQGVLLLMPFVEKRFFPSKEACFCYPTAVTKVRPLLQMPLEMKWSAILL